MKKNKLKALNLLVLPLALTSAGVVIVNNSIKNNDANLMTYDSKVSDTKKIEIKDVSFGGKVTGGGGEVSQGFGGAIVNNIEGENRLYTWGDNSKGQLGLGDFTSHKDPQIVNPLSNSDNELKDIEFGGGHSATVVTDENGNDHLYMWGENSYSQLGLSGNSVDYSFPREMVLPIEGKIKDVSLGANHSGLVITDEDGNDHLFTWGDNSKGQLGLGEGVFKTPTEVSFPIDGKIKDIDFEGQDFSTAVITDEDGNDHLFTWGNNTNGQLGLGDTEYNSHNTPTEVVLPVTGEINDVSLGNLSTSVLVENGSEQVVYGWGLNHFGQLGNENTSSLPITSPIETELPEGEIKFYDSGAFHTGAVIEDNEGNDHLYMVGSNLYGQFGNGETDSSFGTSTSTFEEINLTTIEGEITNLTLNGNSSSITVFDKEGQDHLYTWGYNANGQLGNGSTLTSTGITEVIGLNPSAIRTHYINKLSETEFAFGIVVPNDEIEFDKDSVALYNAKGEQVGTASLLAADEKELSYDYRGTITDLIDAQYESIYWSDNGGQTLNLISTDGTYNFDTPDIDITLPPIEVETNGMFGNYSTGAVAGIGIVAILGVILLIALIAFLLTRRKNK